MVFYDPAIPWTTTPLGPQQDMLSFFEGSGTSSGDEDDPRVVKDETFQKSEVTEFYEEALANYRELSPVTAEVLLTNSFTGARVANREAMPDFEALGGEIILKMSHLTPETTGTGMSFDTHTAADSY